jgi:hypothetical protein
MITPRCSVCRWTNTGCLNIGELNRARWICHGCIKTTIEELEETVADLKRKPWPMSALLAFLNTFVHTRYYFNRGDKDQFIANLERDASNAGYPVKWNGKKFLAFGSYRGWIFGRFIITRMLQSQSAPIVDRGTTTALRGTQKVTFKTIVIRPPLRQPRPVTALVLGWEDRIQTKLNLRQRWKLWFRLRVLGLCPLCNDDAPEVASCIVCCGRSFWTRGSVDDFDIKPEHEAKIRERYVHYCIKPWSDPLPWDIELSQGNSQPELPTFSEDGLKCACESVEPDNDP